MTCPPMHARPRCVHWKEMLGVVAFEMDVDANAMNMNGWVFELEVTQSRADVGELLDIGGHADDGETVHAGVRLDAFDEAFYRFIVAEMDRNNSFCICILHV